MLASLLEQLLDWLCARGHISSRIIWSCPDARIPLLVRYTLLSTKDFTVYVHHLRISDEDRALHDHPWSFITCLLTSGYYEHTPRGRFWRRRFSILWRPAEWAHRLELVRPTWTLVLRLQRRREWGFHLPTGWLDWRAYGRAFCDEDPTREEVRQDA